MVKSFNEQSRNSNEFLSSCEKETFSTRCYTLLRKVPKGRITTYKEIANTLGTRAYRAVGNAMNRNPYDTSKVCCHRVVNSNGELGGYAYEPKIKIELLAEEGIIIKNNKVVDFDKKLFKF